MNKGLNVIITGLIVTLICILQVSAYSKTLEIDNYLLEYSYENPIAGSTFTLTLNVTNQKNLPVNLTFDLDDSSPFDIGGDKEWEVSLAANEEKSKRFVIEVDDDADSQRYDLEFNLDEGNDNWDNYFIIRVVSDSAELELGEIASSPNKITPGTQEVELSITLKNSGEYTAENLIAELELPYGFTQSSSYSTIVHAGDLNSGDTETLIFYFDVQEDLQEEEYNAKLKIQYDSEGEEENKELQIPLPIFLIPQFEITSIEKLSGDIYTGSTSKIKVGVKNIGQEDAKDVSLRVYERSDQPFEFNEKSSYIGSLASGQTGYAIFEFNVDKQATPSKYFIDFQVRALNGEDVLVKDVTSSLEVKKKLFKISDYLAYILLGIVVLGVGFFYLKKRRH